MSSLFYSPFSIFPKHSINSQHRSESIYGFNFKLVYKSENLYSSYVLHPELGDLDSALFLEQLKRNISYVILENLKEEFKLKTSERYFLDYVNHDLVTHATLPKSSSVDEDLKIAYGQYKKGFKRLKFKMNPEFFLDQEYYFNFLNEYKDIECIFDFNSSALFEDFKFLSWEKSILDRVYWEDPILKNIDGLDQLKSMGYKLILDQKDLLHHQRLKPYQDIFDVVAVKPSKESVVEVLDLFPKSKILITTNMGDELDHVISAHWANYVFTNYPTRFFGAGLYTRHFFKEEISPLDVKKERQKITKHSENNPKVRSSFLDLENKDILRGWGLDKEMSVKEWTHLKDIEINFD